MRREGTTVSILTRLTLCVKFFALFEFDRVLPSPLSIKVGIVWTMLGLAIVLAYGAFFQNPTPNQLSAYVTKPDRSFSWHELPRVLGYRALKLTSQTWHGLPWRHSILLSAPRHAVARDTAIIYITGDDPDAADERDADTMCRESGLTVATAL